MSYASWMDKREPSSTRRRLTMCKSLHGVSESIPNNVGCERSANRLRAQSVRLWVAKSVPVAICAGSAIPLRSDREYLFSSVGRSQCMGNGEGNVAVFSTCELEPASGFPVKWPHSDSPLQDFKQTGHRSTSRSRWSGPQSSANNNVVLLTADQIPVYWDRP